MAGDLLPKNIELGGHRSLVIDVALNHEFGGIHDVSHSGELRNADQDPQATTDTTVRLYCDAPQGFLLPLFMSTS
jgi:hypothetical protein